MIKLFDQFDYLRFSEDDIINVIKRKDYIYVKNIKNLPDHDEEDPVRPLDIDEDGLITIEVDGRNYEVKLKNVTKLNENVLQSIQEDDIRQYFYNFTDNFEYSKLEIAKKNIGTYLQWDVEIRISHRDYINNRSKVSNSIDECIDHLTKSIELYKTKEINSFKGNEYIILISLRVKE